MILHWDQLALHYGSELEGHRRHFEAAGQTTYGLLACRFSHEDDRLDYSSGDHAEQRLMNSAVWQTEIPAALEAHGPYSSPIVVTLAINRSPCRNCTRILCEQLGQLQNRFPLRAEANRFILASRGVYEPAEMANATTQTDLMSLHRAGWELCVLQVGPTLPQRGTLLLQGIERVCGRGFVRLG